VRAKRARSRYYAPRRTTWGIEAAVYGPSGEDAHGENEYVAVQTLATQFKVLTHALSQVLGGS
jgi:acetylornithine deacetylase/succinyl-diaminopimelate desuccinylase-like protein